MKHWTTYRCRNTFVSKRLLYWMEDKLVGYDLHIEYFTTKYSSFGNDECPLPHPEEMDDLEIPF